MALTETLGFCLVMMAAYFIEAALGFGGTVTALPLCSMIVGFRVAVPAITAVVGIAALVIILQDKRYIARKVYGFMILHMIPGMPLGVMVSSILPEQPLKLLLGGFTIFVAVRGLVYNRQPVQGKEVESLDISIRSGVCLFLAGVIHGAFSCGGVLAVMYANKAIKDKRSYRVTLSAVWCALNVILTVKNILTGAMTPAAARLTVSSLPFVGVAIVAGTRMMKFLKPKMFRAAVHLLLLVAGCLLVILTIL